MSVRVMGNVWELDLAPSHKLVLLAMADHADHDGRNVHPSVRLIAHKTGYSERQVQRIIRDLEAANILIADAPNNGGRGHTTHYRIVTTNGVILTPFRKGDICEERVTSETGKGDICAVKGDMDVTRTVSEPSREPYSEPTRPHPMSMTWAPAPSTVDGLLALGVHASRVDDLVATYREWYAGKGDKRSDWNPGLLSWARRDLAKADCPLRQAKTQRPATLSASGKEWRW